jgi:hypothetical protein
MGFNSAFKGLMLFTEDEFMLHNHCNTGDAISKLACWDCIPLYQKPPEDETPVTKHAGI